MSDYIRPLGALVGETRIKVTEDRRRHRTCSETIAKTREIVMEELTPSTSSVYARIAAIKATLPLTVETVQITQIVTENNLRYVLSPEMRPPFAVIFVAQQGVNFFVKYARPEDKIALPPFHLSAYTDGWHHVCLGQSYDPSRTTLASLLTVANFTDAYVNVLCLAERLGLDALPKPYDTWSEAMDNLINGRPIEGFQRIEEISL